MATTGFWPVKNSLKDVIEYARNPDKTTNPKYLDNDLQKALAYVKNDDKTDQQLFVSGINCTAKRAYERMTATKKRFGKMGGNVAYHGFQSFKTGEVTPEEAHKIGVETAQRMWGDEYEIVVTTHLNTENLHNHMVLNSVSFKTGRKFENHVSDHYKLREISDEICLEYGVSVLKNATFYNGEKKEYWAHKSGQMTRKDILRRDVDAALNMADTPSMFERQLQIRGYQFIRNGDYAHPSVIVPGWKRAIRLDSLGDSYTKDAIRTTLDDHFHQRPPQYYPNEKPRYKPLLDLDWKMKRLDRMGTLDALIEIFVMLLELVLLGEGDNTKPQPLSPEMRMEVAKLNRYTEEIRLLGENDIHSTEELSAFIAGKEAALTDLIGQRNQVSNRIRRPRSDTDILTLKERRHNISAQITKVRKQLKVANNIVQDQPKIEHQIETERAMETGTPIKNKTNERLYER